MTTKRRTASTKRMALARPIIEERSGGNCEMCGHTFALSGESGFTAWAFEAHHRLSRARAGGDEVSNLLAVHGACHRAAHSRVARSEECGWILPSGSIPAACSLEYMGLPAFLTDDGEVLPIDPYDEIEDEMGWNDADHYRDLLIDDEIL